MHSIHVQILVLALKGCIHLRNLKCWGENTHIWVKDWLSGLQLVANLDLLCVMCERVCSVGDLFKSLPVAASGRDLNLVSNTLFLTTQGYSSSQLALGCSLPQLCWLEIY